MTEDQKSCSLVLDLLQASRGVPRTYHWLETEVKMAGRRCELPSLLEILVDGKMVAKEKDGLGIVRYAITTKGKEALDAL